MKLFTLTLFAVAMAAGCSGDSVTPALNVDASVPYATDLDPLVGKWASGGELALILDREGDRVFVRNPINDTWRFEISKISATGSAISFTQKSFLIDGTAHPFNAVPCDATISPVAGSLYSLTYTLASEHMPAGESDVFTRMSDGG